MDLETDAGLTGRSYLFGIGGANLPALEALVDAMGQLAVTPTAHWLEFVDWAEPVLEEPARVRDGTC